MTTKKKYNKEQAQITADKLTTVFQFIGMFSETDIEYLRGVSEQMKDQSSSLRSVQGVLTDYDRTESKLKWNEQASNRIQGILMIYDAMKETTNIKEMSDEKDGQKEAINKMFGL